MPPMKWMIATVIFVAVLTILGLGAAVVLAYPFVTAFIVGAFIVGTVYLMKRKRQRNLV